MAGRILATSVRHCQKVQNAATMSTSIEAKIIGNREWVCYGMNGQANYFDRVDYPMPAIRYKENTPDVQALREKEKGDWKKLSVEEKKALYRASFCQTFSEMDAPDGQWKSVIGWSLVGFSLSIWYFLYLKKCVLPPPPDTLDLEHRLAQLDRIKKLDIDPVLGINRRS